MTLSELKKLIDLGEDFHLELKESLDKSLIEEVCAFANSSGGKIILGVTDKGIIKGINTDNSTRSKVQDILKQLEPSLDIKLSVIENRRANRRKVNRTIIIIVLLASLLSPSSLKFEATRKDPAIGPNNRVMRDILCSVKIFLGIIIALFDY